ncbi:MAG: HAD-IB family phosphatase [Candidatus ainarchaeum sp.]|nr:HAD-IB family phosphatase [Candidatus ainarchaeum sp.]
MPERSISVIIPALNEERTIAATVSASLKARGIAEVLVVDDKSTDRTVMLARRAGATVITSGIKGKGASMQDGLAAAKGDIIVFVDADIKNFSTGIIDAVTQPLLEDRCDFVKSAYGRKSGRVTELLCKPLLAELFPSLLSFKQPLSGIIAGKKKFFMKANFENDYGVDVGILIDMVNAGARVMEVDVGYIAHKMKAWRQLGGMAQEVARSIIKRASITNKVVQNGIVAEASLIGGMLAKGPEVAFPMEKVAFLDIDGTVLKDRFIYSFARAKGFTDDLVSAVSSSADPYARTRSIASLMRGFSRDDVTFFARHMPFSRGAGRLIANLRRHGYLTVLMSDGYESVAYEVAELVHADRVIANRLHWNSGLCTGAIDINPLYLPSAEGCTHHPVCKLTAAMRFCRMHSVDFEKTFAIGDSDNDRCLLRFANVSYAYLPASDEVASAAKYVINDLADVKVF